MLARMGGKSFSDITRKIILHLQKNAKLDAMKAPVDVMSDTTMSAIISQSSVPWALLH